MCRVPSTPASLPGPGSVPSKHVLMLRSSLRRERLKPGPYLPKMAHLFFFPLEYSSRLTWFKITVPSKHACTAVAVSETIPHLLLTTALSIEDAASSHHHGEAM